jgi:hypothetical protein
VGAAPGGCNAIRDRSRWGYHHEWRSTSRKNRPLDERVSGCNSPVAGQSFSGGGASFSPGSTPRTRRPVGAGRSHRHGPRPSQSAVFQASAGGSQPSPYTGLRRANPPVRVIVLAPPSSDRLATVFTAALGILIPILVSRALSRGWRSPPSIPPGASPRLGAFAARYWGGDV